MNRILKELIPLNLKRYYWRYLKKRAKAKKKRIKFDGNTPKETFTFIHDTNYWSGKDSLSGGGSDLHHTKVVVEKITALISELKIESVLDIPCGDFAWMQYVDLTNTKYMGGDIVDDLIQNNVTKYKDKPNIQFKVVDLINDELPSAEVLINRDCLVHLSFDDVFKALHNIKQSGCKYLLTTTFPNHLNNQDITTGDWRTLNLEEAPFYFPKPLRLIHESYNHQKYGDKSLGLWDISDLFLERKNINGIL